METNPKARTQFSLFEGDALNRLFGVIHLGGRRPMELFWRSLIVFCFTWLPMALLAVNQGLYSAKVEPTNFFADFAAYAQFLFALPLFIVAEAVISMYTREAAKVHLSTGVVAARYLPQIETINEQVERLRKAWQPEVILIILAYAIALATILPEFFDDSINTWHTTKILRRVVFTQAGSWATFIALPILNYWWLRWVWKIAIWTWYLYKVSRLRLSLVASHPDHTGGIGFISTVQAKFGLVIFAYGVSNVAAVVAYKVGIEGADYTLPPVWGPVLGFVIVAPLLFIVPLFMFTKQLFRTKKRALRVYRERAMKRARIMEKRWLNIGPDDDSEGVFDLEQQTSFSEIFQRIERMRVVPFDFRSLTQLVGSTIGSVATALPLVKLEGPLTIWLQVLAAFLSGRA